MENDRFDRQIRFFGREGQERIEKTTVAIVGLGGLGSHVAQQLAYLGVRGFVLIDRDIVSSSNLNRLIGATRQDVEDRRHKVGIAERVIRSVDPAASPTVQTIEDSFICCEGFGALRDVDVVFGCMDRAAPRLILTEFCQAYEKPYVDSATDIGSEGGLWFGGRVLFSLPGEACLHCMDKLDQDELRADFSTAGQLADDARIYGVRRDDLGETGPAVVFLNGLLASIAVTEFAAHVAGFRPAKRSLEYKGIQGVVSVDRDPAVSYCHYCQGIKGRPKAADVERYVREGWGERF